MKLLRLLPVSLLASLLPIATANAWHLSGQVKCANEVAFKNVIINVNGTSCNGPFSSFGITDSDGLYSITLPDCDGTFTTTIDVTTLPADATIVSPANGTHTFSTTVDDDSEVVDWIIDSAVCAQKACWFTGGGAKIDPVFNAPAGHKGKWISFGGNVNPGCSPTAGDGGNWNHVDRLLNLHFQGRTIIVTACGNVTPPPPPGSTSPVTPFNYIEWTGQGTLRGIQGNKFGPIPVFFSARTEDRNEPGTKDSNAGAGIDRYYLDVYTDPANRAGTTILLVNGDTNPLNVVPVEIDDGNFQLHVSSCDNPPTP
jgi:hypothetical protein